MIVAESRPLAENNSPSSPSATGNTATNTTDNNNTNNNMTEKEVLVLETSTTTTSPSTSTSSDGLQKESTGVEQPVSTSKPFVEQPEGPEADDLVNSFSNHSLPESTFDDEPQQPQEESPPVVVRDPPTAVDDPPTHEDDKAAPASEPPSAESFSPVETSWAHQPDPNDDSDDDEEEDEFATGNHHQNDNPNDNDPADETTNHEEELLDTFDDATEAPPPAPKPSLYEDDVSITLSMQSNTKNSTAGGGGPWKAPLATPASPAATLESYNPWAAATPQTANNNNTNNQSLDHSARTAPRMVSFFNTTEPPPRSGNNGSHIPSSGDSVLLGGVEDAMSVRSQSTRHTAVTTTTNNMDLLARPLVETHMAVRVMKGEIHNVLTVMRSSEHSLYMSAQRFTEELTEESHPLVQQFQDLHFTLSDWDLQMAAHALYRRQRSAATALSTAGGGASVMGGAGESVVSQAVHDASSSPLVTPPDALMYLPPFCVAVTTREINAPVTGACLTALHKFLLYGFVHPAKDAQAGMTMIAKALLHCTFEETAAPPPNTTNTAAAAAKQRQQSWRKQMQQHQQQQQHGSLTNMGSSDHSDDGSATVSAQNTTGGTNNTASTNNNANNKRGTRKDAEAAQREEQAAYYHPTRVNDEQVVLKLLDLAALVVRCSFLGTYVNGNNAMMEQLAPTTPTGCLLDADLVVGLLDTCLHVSHIAKSASPLLKSAASDALGQIVLQVFSHQKQPPQSIPAPIPVNIGSSSRSLGAASAAAMPGSDSPRQQVLAKLASLLNPANHDEQVIVSSLTAVNIALETAKNEDNMSPQEVSILQNDLFKYLLQWSTTSDLHILSLTLRVIFNLFQSIPNHLKVPLEVFLTSVHLRILDAGNNATAAALRSNGLSKLTGASSSTVTSALGSSPTGAGAGNTPSANHEEREVVLESILEYCQEPALMQDIYRNYDCDVACSNLFELIVSALGKTAMPNDSTHPLLVAAATGASSRTVTATDSDGSSGRPKLESGESISKLAMTYSTPTPARTSFFTVNTTTPTPFMQLNKLALEALCAILNLIARRVHADRSPFLRELGLTSMSMDNSMGMIDSFMMNSMADMSIQNQSVTGSVAQMSEEELHQRRQRKNALVQVAQLFNEDFTGQGWLDMAVNLDVLDATDNAKGVAEILYSASGLDKAKLGIYLSKGPESSFPFHTKVRQQFIELYDFTDLNFSAALRLFLSRFRLPGEAQCIDRFMESFSSELYKQQSGNMSTFKDADAVYVLSFSTIMLNTDLHNPTIKESNRMTKEQFIKNNRGINAGEDLPVEYLSDLYDQIKGNQIQVQREVGEFMKKQEYDKDFRSAWDSILAKHKEVATAFFTHAGDARRNIYKTGVHDKEMFTILVKWALVALPAVFNRSWDDAIVFRSLRGFKQMAMIADHFGMDDVVNEIIELLLTKGRDYVINCIMLDHNPKNHIETDGEDETTTQGETHGDSESQIPYSLLSSGKGYTEVDYTGAAHHRGLLALDTGFLLVRRYARKVVSAWPLFIECLCAMRDARALPSGLSDLDDFADSNGNVLPLSPYAKVSQRRLDHFYSSKAMANARGAAATTEGQPQQEGWFSKLFKTTSTTKVPTAEELEKTDGRRTEGVLCASTRAVLAVAESANVEKIVQMGSTKLPVAEQTIRSLLDVVDAYPYDDDPVNEQHAIFSLELAARALLSNRDRAVDIFPVFLSKFENILGQVSDKGVPSPFVIERIVVTILRCSIHLYDLEELRPNLRVSLHLLIMSIPRSFIRDVADRMACGLAIILRASFPFFESHNEWTFMRDTLDTLANFSSARVFVFDGIASTVECAVPHQGRDKDESGYGDDEYENETIDDSKTGDDIQQQFALTKEACGALSRILIRFVLGFYQSDFTLSVPASVCLEKLYYRMNSLALDEKIAAAAKAGNPIELTEKERRSKVPNKDYWQNVTVALYSVCRSPDPDVSRHGYEICQRVILRTSLREIPADKWLGILYLMVSKQPPTAADLSRANTFVLLGNMLMRLLPYLSKKQKSPSGNGANEEKDENFVDAEDLTDVVRQTASLAGENLRNGRRGRVSPLFEKTLQTVTYLSNHMQTDEWKGDREFGTWASEALLAELEKVGAAGASLQNQVAIQEKSRDDDYENKPEVLETESPIVAGGQTSKPSEVIDQDEDEDDDED